MAQLRDNPQLMPGAIEQMVRFEGPLQRNPRRAAEDLEFADQHMRRNDTGIARNYPS
jgi:hypothetical protein